MPALIFTTHSQTVASKRSATTSFFSPSLLIVIAILTTILLLSISIYFLCRSIKYSKNITTAFLGRFMRRHNCLITEDITQDFEKGRGIENSLISVPTLLYGTGSLVLSDPDPGPIEIITDDHSPEMKESSVSKKSRHEESPSNHDVEFGKIILDQKGQNRIMSPHSGVLNVRNHRVEFNSGALLIEKRVQLRLNPDLNHVIPSPRQLESTLSASTPLFYQPAQIQLKELRRRGIIQLWYTCDPDTSCAFQPRQSSPLAVYPAVSTQTACNSSFRKLGKEYWLSSKQSIGDTNSASELLVSLLKKRSPKHEALISADTPQTQMRTYAVSPSPCLKLPTSCLLSHSIERAKNVREAIGISSTTTPHITREMAISRLNDTSLVTSQNMAEKRSANKSIRATLEILSVSYPKNKHSTISAQNNQAEKNELRVRRGVQHLNDITNSKGPNVSTNPKVHGQDSSSWSSRVVTTRCTSSGKPQDHENSPIQNSTLHPLKCGQPSDKVKISSVSRHQKQHLKSVDKQVYDQSTRWSWR